MLYAQIYAPSGGKSCVTCHLEYEAFCIGGREGGCSGTDSSVPPSATTHRHHWADVLANPDDGTQAGLAEHVD